jgi:hypothetical protein
MLSWASGVGTACLGANHLQTNHAELGGTGRSSAARSPNGAARDGSRRNRRHEPTGLITQRSLVQIQPAQRNGWSQGVSEGSSAPSCLQIVLTNPARFRDGRCRKTPGRRHRASLGSRIALTQRGSICKRFANAPSRLGCPGGSGWSDTEGICPRKGKVVRRRRRPLAHLW